MKPDVPLRITLTISGILAGLAGWQLVEILPDYLQDNFRLLMTLGIFTGLFFSVFLVAAGPLRPAAAFLAALIVAVPATILFLWASFRYADPAAFLESGLPIIALMFGTGIAVPFTITVLARRGDWSDYATLFTEAWNIFTRSTAAAVFTGIVWMVVLLSDQLLRLVGLTFIGDLLKHEVVPSVLTGAALGLALAVVHELSAYVTPYLILRLLRLLLPLVLVVSVIFLAALPLRGLSDLFGNFSSALILMSIAFGAMTLVTVALDQRDEDAVDAVWMQYATRALALLVPALAALAVWAVLIRVGEYGWTPERLAAMTAAVVLLGYGLSYAVAVLRGARWMYLIRRANVWMALATLGLCVLWLTPLLNAERISVNSQIARLEAGKVTVADIDLWPVARGWGRAADAGLVRLKALNLPDQAALNTRIAAVEGAKSAWDYSDDGGQRFDATAVKAALAAIEVLPAGTKLPFALDLDEYALEQVSKGCDRDVLGKPGCLVVVGDFLTDLPGQEVMLIYFEYDSTGAQVTLVVQGAGALTTSDIGYIQADTVQRLRDGEFTIGAPPIQVLTTGNVTLTPRP